MISATTTKMTLPIFVFVSYFSFFCSRQKSLSIARLNRLLLERSELGGKGDVVLASGDDRAVYVREQIWRGKQKIDNDHLSQQRSTLRVGVVNGGVLDDCRANLATNGDVVLDGRALRELENVEAPRPKLDLMLALPAPLRLKRILPIVSSLGIDSLWLVGTKRSDRAFFGSAMLKDLDMYTQHDDNFAPTQAALGTKVRDLLIEGAEQSGCTAIPNVALVSTLSTALRNIRTEDCVCCAAHPDRGDDFRTLDSRTGKVC